ncbi:MAG: hypothetical protein JNK15_15095 [Planctomycetes bacterium]|nr:hypothetical protein [Planctomycetota bacterium]
MATLEVRSERAFVALCTFVERVGQLLQRRVVLQWELRGPVVLAWAPQVGFTAGDPHAWHPPRAQRFRRWAIAAIPVAAIVFWLAYTRVFPSGVLVRWLGPGPPRMGESAPPYLGWDIGTMLAMVCLAIGALAWLARPFVVRWIAARRARR